VKQQPFEAKHRPLWQALRGWLANEPTVAPEEVPAAYRQVIHHLAMARERRYTAALVEELQQLVMALHQRLYGVRAFQGRRVFRFLLQDLPRQVRAQRRVVLASLLLFLGPLVAAYIAVRLDPDLVHLVLDRAQAAQIHQMYSPEGLAEIARSGSRRDVQMFGFYILNNTSIDFQCFASGVLAGVGPAFLLAFNGLHMGAVSAFLANEGFTRAFYGFVSGHSAPELTGVVLSGAAGLRLGLALLHPGRMSRKEALREAGRDTQGILMGAALLTVSAAFVEGFWSANPAIPHPLKIAAGVAAWAALLGWLGLAGREA